MMILSRLRFSFRFLMLLVTLLAIGLGYHARLVDLQRETVAAITALGGSVEYWSPLPYGIAEAMGFDRVGYVKWVRLRQPFVHLALEHLQSLPALEALEVACLEDDRARIETSLFADIMRESLPEVSVNYVNDKWFFLPVPKAIAEGMPEKIDARLYVSPFFQRTDAVRANDGAIRFVLWEECAHVSIPGRDYAIAVLMDCKRVLDWKSVIVNTRGGLIEGVVEDVNGDGQLDVAIRINAELPGPFFGLNPDAKSLPNDDRKWMAAYSVEFDGLLSIFPEGKFVGGLSPIWDRF